MTCTRSFPPTRASALRILARRGLVLGSMLLAGLFIPAALPAADWTIEVQGPREPGGHVRAVIYDDPLVYAADGRPGSVRSVRWEGTAATLVFEGLEPGDHVVRLFLDADDDGRFDPPGRGGVGGELVGYSRDPLLRSPQPPTWDRVRVAVGEDGRSDVITLGVRPSPWSLGLGAVISTQPYEGLDEFRVIPIPAISYRGPRLRVEGPFAEYAFVIAPPVRLSLTAAYRFDGYDPDDSNALTGMDEREDTVEAGLRLNYRAPGGLRLDLRGSHDLLGRNQGGTVALAVGRPIRWETVTLEPFIRADWLSSEFADYYFGVDHSEAAPGRPRTRIGSAVQPRVGVNVSWFFGERWLALARTSVEIFDDDVRDSPIVDDDIRLRLILAASYTF